MNPRAARRAWRVLAAACLLLAPGAMQAQTAAELGARVAALQDSVKAIQTLIREEQARAALPLDDSVMAGGIVIRFPSVALSTSDRDALRDGIAQASSSLASQFGEDATQLLTGEATLLNVRSRTDGKYEAAVFTEAGTAANTAGRSVTLPLTSDVVAGYLLERAGRRVMQRDSVLRAFGGTAFSLNPNPSDFYIARRQLAMSRSSIARRCGEGSVPACRTVLDIRYPKRRFAAGDTIPGSNSPFPQGVHGTLLTVALGIGGGNALQAIGTTEGLDEPVAILATVAGVSPDSLLRAWSERLRESGDENVTPSFSFAAAVVGWCGIFLLAATRRRPQ